ncbi:MAG TPA: hypothetical protein PLW31_04490 [Bacteroidales bacterium]|nr:hypothetical protein [Bacteroidales bacterium]HOX77277.1 hypothetical protein [Bacteroidales bacterium]
MSFVTEGASFIDYSYAQAGFGVKAFINQHLAWDTSLNYGLSVSDPAYGVIILMTGLSYVF